MVVVLFDVSLAKKKKLDLDFEFVDKVKYQIIAFRVFDFTNPTKM